MAFWGVEVVPKQPFVLKVDIARTRIHVSQAILGEGSSPQKVTMACSVGRQEPVLICCLTPESPSSLLDIEFEEDEDVTFVIKGQRSIHLSGYFRSAYIYFRHQTHGQRSGASDETSCPTDASNTEERLNTIRVFTKHFVTKEGMQVTTRPDRLVIETIGFIPGNLTDQRADSGDKVYIFYTGMLKDNGTIFGFNYGKRAFKFILGQSSEVIEGWNSGVYGMCLGEKRRLTVPPFLGYGSEGAKNIPPNAWLVYEISLVGLKRASRPAMN